MPLLQGQPFKLVDKIHPSNINGEIFTIEHTGEQFLNKRYVTRQIHANYTK